MILFASWNVNGLRACTKKGFVDWVKNSKADIISLQEIKLSEGQVPEEVLEMNNYNKFYSYAEKKGYSGVALFVKKTIPIPKVEIGLGIKKFDTEGRTIISIFNNFILFSCYFPNGGKELKRVPFKLEYSKAVAKKALLLKKETNKPIIITGDYNTAHNPIDLKNPSTNKKNTGFLPIEREWLDQFIDQGFHDIFRLQHPNEEGHYTWWSYRFNCRTKNIGWRIDYFFITNELLKLAKKTWHGDEIMGSDHCPIYLKLKIDKE